MMSDAIPPSLSVLYDLAGPAIRSMAIGLAAGSLLLAFRVKRAQTRLLVWTAVLYAALAMPFLALWLPKFSVTLPPLAEYRLTNPWPGEPMKSSLAQSNRRSEIRAHPAPPNAAYTNSDGRVLSTQSAEEGVAPGLRAAAPDTAPVSSSLTSSEPHVSAASRDGSGYRWPVFVCLAYVLVGLALAARIAVGALLAGRLSQNADTITDARARRLLLGQAQAAGLKSAPRLAASDLVAVPIALGIFRPVILLPARWHAWDDTTVSAVMAHELSHVARRDALTQRLALVHRAIFWFSPLAWWLNHALIDAAETASDEAALAAGTDRIFYAETLLGFFAALSESSGRVYWQGVSIVAPGQAERRVDRILNWKGSGIGLQKKAVVAAIVVGLPCLLLAAAARPVSGIAPPQPVRAQSVASRPQPVSAPAPPLAATATRTGGAPAAPATEVRTEALTTNFHDFDRQNLDAALEALKEFDNTEVEKQIASSKGSWKFESRAFPYSVPFDAQNAGVVIRSRDGGDRYVIVSNQLPIIVSGNSADVEHAAGLRSKISGDFIWFEHDQKSYIIRDQNVVNQARAYLKPAQDFGDQQLALGQQQRGLGDQMRDLGEKMRETKVNVPDISDLMQKLTDQLKLLSASGATAQELGELERQLGQLERQIGEAAAHAADPQRQISAQMHDLGEKMRDLGSEQRGLGQKQRDASRLAQQQMKQLLDGALRSGTAQPE